MKNVYLWRWLDGVEILKTGKVRSLKDKNQSMNVMEVRIETCEEVY